MNNQLSVTELELAASCARKLAEWFGSAEDAAKALTDDPVAMVEIAVTAAMEDRRAMTVSALMNIDQFSRQVLAKIR